MKLFNVAKEILRNKAAKMILGAMLVATPTVLVLNNHENAREYKRPIGFSEISQMEEDIKRETQNPEAKLEPMTYFYAKSSDLAMKIFEAWNNANSTFHYDRNNFFASELEYHVAYKEHHYTLKSLFGEVKEISKKAFVKFGDFIKVNGRMVNTNNAFEKSWDDTHIDTTHENCTTDDKGNTSCTTVCDYTTHYYTYHPNAGEQASAFLDSVLADNPNLKFPEKLKTPSKTNAEGEYAAEVSRNASGGPTPLYTQRAELWKIAALWNYGSDYSMNESDIMSSWKKLHSDADAWRRDKQTAHNETFITGCNETKSPKEFDTAKRALKNGNEFVKLTGEIIEGIEYVKNNAPKLEEMISRFIEIKLDHKPGNARKLVKEIMRVNKMLYKKNFKGGFDVDGYRWHIIAIGAGIAIPLGAGIGYGIHLLTEGRSEYGYRRRRGYYL